MVDEPSPESQTYSFDFEGPDAERLVVRMARVEVAERSVGWIASDVSGSLLLFQAASTDNPVCQDEPEWRVNFTGIASSNGTAAISSMDSFLDPSAS